jgi:DNA-binding NtrC family response regulator
MIEKKRWAFIIDQDEFVRLSLSKILQKYGFQVEEIEELSQLEGRERDVRGGMVLADVEIDVLERWLSLLKKWNDRFILISPLITEELTHRLKKIGIQRIIKKPVDPKILRGAVRKIFSPERAKVHSLGKKGEVSRFKQKGGEGTRKLSEHQRSRVGGISLKVQARSFHY